MRLFLRGAEDEEEKKHHHGGEGAAMFENQEEDKLVVTIDQFVTGVDDLAVRSVAGAMTYVHMRTCATWGFAHRIPRVSSQKKPLVNWSIDNQKRARDRGRTHRVGGSTQRSRGMEFESDI
jgi:hypothetical protein